MGLKREETVFEKCVNFDSFGQVYKLLLLFCGCFGIYRRIYVWYENDPFGVKMYKYRDVKPVSL